MRFPFAFLGLGLLVLGTGHVAAEPRFRADDGNLWRATDNPALAAVSGDFFSLGAAVSPENRDWAALDRATNDIQLISPLISFRYAWKGSDSVLQLGTALGPLGGVSAGYRSDAITTSTAVGTTHNFGLLWRPLDAFSGAVTVDDAFGPRRLWGAGVAFRPLAFAAWEPTTLTLTADATWDGALFSGQRLGARLAWRGSDVRLWYEPSTSVPGVEVTLALGPAETTWAPDRLGQALRWASKTPERTTFGALVLRIRDVGTLAAAPRPTNAWPLARKPDLPTLVDLLDRASQNRTIEAVAFEGPPNAGALAADQELRAALERFKAAGKKVYVHADSYDDGMGFEGWISAADRISVDPTGSVALASGGSRRLYLKDFFDKVGVQFVNFAPWETKSANNTLTYSSMPDGERTMLKRFLTDRDDLAATALAAGRGAKLKAPAADLVAKGPYLVAREALDAGLVDALETRTDFEDFLKLSHPGATLTDDLPPARETGWGPPVAKKTVAVVHLVGDIVGGPGQAATSIGREAAETVRALREDGSVAALVLRVDSPGGAVTPSAIVSDEVKKTVAAGKPVVVVMGDLAASGGYYLSAPASRIIARPGTLTGSIGVTAALMTAPKALDLLGIKADGVDLGPSAAFGDWTRPVSEADGQKWKAMIQATYDRFLDVVAEGRHLEKSTLEPLARGQVYTGREALALGLVDELGGMDEAKAWLEKKLGARVDFQDVVPGQNDPFGGLLGALASAAIGSSASPSLRLASTLDRLAAPWAEAAAGVAARGGGPLVWMDPTFE